MEVCLLGAVALRTPSGPVELGTPQQRCVFAALALTPGTPVSVEALIERVWGPDVDRDVRPVIYTHVSRLRTALRGADAGPDDETALARRDGGYALEIDPDRVDLHRGRKLVERARGASRNGVPEPSALELLDEAAALWTDHPLAGLTGDWVDRVRTALVQERLALEVERLGGWLKAGRHDQATGPLSSLLAAQPLAEPVAELLMLALHRAGRQADALEVYAQLHRRLVDELGDGPGPSLQQLHARILRRDPQLRGSVRAELTPDGSGGQTTTQRAVGSAWTTVCQLPPIQVTLVGRDAEAAPVRAALADTDGRVPLVVVSGISGIGKTTFALHLAHELRAAFPDGQWFVRLGGQGAPRPPDRLLGELLETSGVEAAQLPEGTDRRAAALRSRLTDRRVLLVLDDAVTAAQVRDLLPGTAGSSVLITSRRRLDGLDGAQVVRLRGLDHDAALQLLRDRAGPSRIDAEPAAAAELVAACRGLPLALRIAGARLALHPRRQVAWLATRLADARDRLDELTHDDLAVRPGLELTVRALPTPLRAAFRALGTVDGLDVAAWMLGVLVGRDDGERLADGLLDANLLEQVGNDATGEPRYRLPDLVATYARELVADARDVEAELVERRLRALLALADHAYAQLHVDAADLPPNAHPIPPPPAGTDLEVVTRVPTAWLVAEREQVLQVLARACTIPGLHRPAAALADRVLTHVVRVHVGSHEISRLFARLRDRAREAGDELVAWRAQARLETELAVRGHLSDAADGLAACAAAFGRLGARSEQAFTLAGSAVCRALVSDPARQLHRAERALAIAREADARTEAWCSCEYGSILSRAGRHSDAVEAFERALELSDQHGLAGQRSATLRLLSGAALRRGDLDAAEGAYERALASLEATADPRGAAWLQLCCAEIELRRGRPRSARHAAADAVERFIDCGDERGLATARQVLGESLLGAGDDAGSDGDGGRVQGHVGAGSIRGAGRADGNEGQA